MSASPDHPSDPPADPARDESPAPAPAESESEAESEAEFDPAALEDDDAGEPPAPEDDPLLQSVKFDQLPELTESIRLVHEIQAGHEEAVALLMERYHNRLHRIVRIRLSAKLRRCVESVDIMQETWRSALGRIQEFELRSTASIIQWLSKIVQNQLIDTHRFYYANKRDRSREVHLADDRRGDDEAPGAVVPSKIKTPDQDAYDRDMAALVDEAVGELPDDYREVIMLRTYYGGSWDFVTKEMGRLTSEATRQLHRRARIRLGRIMRAKLAERTGADPEADPASEAASEAASGSARDGGPGRTPRAPRTDEDDD